MNNWKGYTLGLASLLVSITALAQNSSKTASGIPDGIYNLAGIKVEGANYTDNETIILLSGLVLGQKIELPSEIFSETVNKLWKQDLFSDVRLQFDRLEGEDLYIILLVAERPRLTNYRISGIGKAQTEDLSKRIAFVRGTIFTETKKRAADRIIRNFYQEKGFLDVAVNINTDYDTLVGNNGVSVNIRVNKGPRVKIRNIYVDGLQKISRKKVLKKLKKTRERAPGKFWRNSKYTNGTFAEDKTALIEFFNSQGLRDAEVVDDSISRIYEKEHSLFGFFNKNKRKTVVVPGRIDLHMKLYEGPTYYFGDIKFVGNRKYEEKVLASVLDIKRGDIYDKEKLGKKLSGDANNFDVSSLYLDDGYLFFNAEPIELLAKNDTINLEIRIYEGPQATISKIILEGNETTLDHVILREVRTLPGEKFSRALIIRTQREIVNLGFFDQENMNVLPIPNPQRGTVDIKFVLPERSNDQITLQGGYSGKQRDINGNTYGGGVVATIGLQFNNFSTRKIFKKGAWTPIPRGQGQKLSLTYQTNGTQFTNYAVSFLEPWFGGKKPNSFGVSVNYSQQKQPRSTGDYKFNIIGLSVDLGRRLKFPDDFFRSYTTFSYRNYKFENAGDIFGIGTTSGNINIFSIKQAFDRTSIDQPIFSTSGSSINLSAEATPPWSLITGKDLKNESSEEKFRLLEFYKIKFDAGVFLPLTSGKKPLVLYPRVRTGFLGFYNADIGISPFERFYIGGTGIQGFNIDGREIIQLRGYEAPFGPEGSEGRGGTSFVKYTMELRQPITLEASSMIWIHAFVEAGNSWSTIKEYNPFVVKRAAGFGLRAFLPMFGLLGLDYGFGLDPTFNSSGIANKSGVFHFIIGQQF